MKIISSTGFLFLQVSFIVLSVARDKRDQRVMVIHYKNLQINYQEKKQNRYMAIKFFISILIFKIVVTKSVIYIDIDMERCYNNVCVNSCF